ncbi:MAG: AI-2E family transporter [Microgenomates group bacterium]
MVRKVEISHKTIIFTFFFLVSIWFVYYIRDIVLQVFGAFLLVSILNPLILKLSKYKIPKAVSIVFSYILIFGFLGLAVGSIVPPLVEETTNLANSLPSYFQSSEISKYVSDEAMSQFVSQLGSLPGQVVRAVFSVFNNVLSIITVAIFAFYLLLVRDRLDSNLEFLFGKDKAKNYSDLVNVLEVKLGGWARGQFLLMFIIGLLTYTGLLVLGIPYALPLAMLAGIFEIVPYVGPIVAAIPAVVLGFSVSPFLGLATVGLTILIQQLENYILVPKIMEKSTGVSPIVILISLAVGYRLAGITGMIFSIPLVMIIQVLIQARIKDK